MPDFSSHFTATDPHVGLPKMTFGIPTALSGELTSVDSVSVEQEKEIGAKILDSPTVHAL